jgi:SOS response associated peptidase (SRAP)
MSGRYAVTTAPEAILRLFRIAGTAPNLPPHYNAAPGQDLPVIRLHPETGERVLGELRWGLIPHWPENPARQVSSALVTQRDAEALCLLPEGSIRPIHRLRNLGDRRLAFRVGLEIGHCPGLC